MLRSLLIAFLIMLAPIAQADEIFSNDLVQRMKKGVVSIENNVSFSAYSSNTKSFASGFIVDKKNGIVLTNKHVAKRSQINDITVTFFNGREIPAQFLYDDPWHDFAFLKIDTKEIPQEAVELKFAKGVPQNEDPVIIIGNNQGQNFSIQTGIVSSKYETVGMFPNQTYRISLNTRGGSSGSPILNKDGEIVALNFAGDDTYAYGLKIAYAFDALQYVRDGKEPPRRSTGALLEFYSLDKSTKYNSFPKNWASQYIKDYPDSFNRAIRVVSIMPGTPAEDLLMPGDVILQVNDKSVGPDLYSLQKMQNGKNQKVKFGIVREGKKRDIFVGLYDLYGPEVKRMLSFGGAVFYEANDSMSLITGAQKGSLFVSNINEGSPFKVFPALNKRDGGSVHLVKITKLAGKAVNSIDDVVQLIPELVKQKNFTVNFQNYSYHIGYDDSPFFNRNEQMEDITYVAYDSEPTVLNYNPLTRSWDSQRVMK